MRPAITGGPFSSEGMMPETSSEIARRLAERAFDVCRRYLPNGKRVGDYWVAGDARGAKGRSLFVRLVGPTSGKRAAGKWQDAATGEHGDLLDLIAASCRFSNHRDVRGEARRFLNDASFERPSTHQRSGYDSVRAAQTLFAAAQQTNEATKAWRRLEGAPQRRFILERVPQLVLIHCLGTRPLILKLACAQ